MKLLLLLFAFCSFTFDAIAQTKIISHKSHSGAATSFSSTTQDNFGLAPRVIKKVVKLDKNTVVEVGEFAGMPVNDTITEHPFFLNSKLSLEELEEQFPHIQFVGFDKKYKKTKAERKANRAKKKALKQATGQIDFPFELAAGSFVLCLGLGFIFYKQA